MARIRRKRRWLTRVVLALLVVSIASYAYVTRPGALEAAVDRALAAAGFEIAGTRTVSFSPWSGLTLADVRLRPSGSAGTLGGESDIRIARVTVRVSPLALLRGRMSPQRIELDQLQLHVTRADVEKQLERWTRGGGEHERGALWPQDLPELVIRRADVQISESGERGPQLVRRWILSGTGRSMRGDNSATDPARYELRLEQVAGPGVGASRFSRAPFLLIRVTPEALHASLGPIELDTLAALGPAEVAARLARLGLAGRVSAALESAPGGLRRIRLELADLTGIVPFEAADYSGRRFLRLSRISGPILVHPARGATADRAASWDVSADLEGRANDATLRVLAGFEGCRFQASSGSGVDPSWLSMWSAARSELTVEIAGLEMPDVARHEAFICAPQMPPAIREFFRDFVPRGRMNANVTVGWMADAGEPHGPGQVRFAGFAEPLNAYCRYYKFPYDFDDVCGRVTFSNDGIVVEGLDGRHGTGRIHMTGRLASSFKWTGFDLHFVASDVPLNQDLFDALPESQQRVWARADPIGLADLDIHLSRPDGTPETGPAEPTVHIDAQLLAANLSLPGDRRLKQALGRLEINDDQLRMHHLTGFLDDAMVTLSGPIDLRDAAPESGERVRVEAGNVAVRQSTTMRGERQQQVGALRFEGTADAWGSVASTGRGLGDQFVLRLHDGSLFGFGGASAWANARGWVFADASGYRVLDFTAGEDGRRVAASGRLSGTQDSAAPLEMELEVSDPSLSSLLGGMVPQRWDSVRSALGLDGAGRVHLSLKESPSAGLLAQLELNAERMVPTALPLRFRSVGARLTLRESGFDLHEATAVCGEEANVRLTGDGDWNEQQSWSRFRVDAQHLRLDDALIGALPAGLQRLLERLEARGRLDVALDRVRIVERPHPEWDVSGAAQLHDAVLMLGLDLRDFDGELKGEVGQDPAGRLAIAAAFKVSQGRLAGRALSDALGEIRLEPGAEWVSLDRLNARICDGTVVGNARVHVENGQYELSLTLADVRLDQLVDGKAESATPARPGRVDGRVFLRGSGRDPTTRRGGGELRIRDASLLSSPVTRSVAQASAERNRPLSEGVDEARLKFAWEGTRLDFTHVDIWTRDVHLIGTGYWDAADDSISLELLAAGPDVSLRVPILSELIEGAGQELLQFRVSGRAAAPRVTVEPLHNLTEPLRRALSGEG